MVGNDMIVAIGAEVGCLVVDDHPTKDRHSINYFFYVKISEASVGPSGFPPYPDGLFTEFLYAEMAAQERAQAENLTADVETNPAGGQEGGVQDQPIVGGEISEVLQEKLKKSRRSKKPPRVPVSDGVIPSSEVGASASGTALEQDEESHSTRRKKKRSRRSPSVGRVPSPVRAVITDGISESVIDDSKTAAWFANIQYHGNDGPLPAELVADPDFGLMSRHGSRAYQRRCVEAEERATEESAKASILQRQLTEEKIGITSRIKRATRAAMRTFATKFQGKIDRAKEKIRTLGGNPKKKLVQLAQVEANIKFARLLREAPTRLTLRQPEPRLGCQMLLAVMWNLTVFLLD
ncbi:hypothetical protein AALP_AAs39674U000100 [Arabis alpina]|uniref:Uncharacterized protein n=1 Tax=Arabis alpina TaxID=50452 RepID=A0A087FWS3_ARAAL|nr:hypothetical protein AALP_AAs39674U000100 [Arabis alpina]